MTSNNSASSGGNIGIFGMMGVMFIGMKIAGVIAWPWVWVLAPLWAPSAVVIVIAFIVGVIVEMKGK
jgi:hypothetical protein